MGLAIRSSSLALQKRSNSERYNSDIKNKGNEGNLSASAKVTENYDDYKKKPIFLKILIYSKLYYGKKIQKNGLQFQIGVKKSPIHRKKKTGSCRQYLWLCNIMNWCNIPNAAILFKRAEEGTIRIVQ